MDDIAEQLAIRDRFQRNRQWQMTPEQRMEAMRQMQVRAWAVLLSSPNGYAHFRARNFKKRAIEVADAT